MVLDNRNKKIATNTIYLYLRTFVTMTISLYTSRVILQALGATDFGIYNVVGGVIVLFSFINNAMTASTQRYLNYEIGRNGGNAVTKVFSHAMVVHLCITGVIIILGETLGLWIFNTQLNIPANKIHSALWVYQLTILSSCISILRCPYHASIIAYEKMNFYAWLSILEAAMKLVISWVIMYYQNDKLVLYAILLCTSTLLITLFTQLYCIKNFALIRLRFQKDIQLLRELLSFSSWSLFGSAANVAAHQGVSIVLNSFFGVIINAAIGIANQVNSIASVFVSNFQTAFMPQITKSYAAKDYKYFVDLITKTSRYSFLLIFSISFPIFMNCEYILGVWLGKYPDYSIQLTQIILVCTVLDALAGPFWMAVYATGNLKKYQITISLILFSYVLTCFCAVKMNYGPIYAFSTKIILLMVAYIYRLSYIKKIVQFSLKKYAQQTLGRCIVVIVCALILNVTIAFYVQILWLKLAITILLSILCVYILGITHNERKKVMQVAMRAIKNIF